MIQRGKIFMWLKMSKYAIYAMWRQCNLTDDCNWIINGKAAAIGYYENLHLILKISLCLLSIKQLRAVRAGTWNSVLKKQDISFSTFFQIAQELNI